VLFYSKDTSENTIIQAYEAGIKDYLSKPSPPGLLRAKARILLSVSSAEIASAPKMTEEVLAGESFIPAYKIIEKLGSGSTGQVYKAIHKISLEVVAIKVLHHTNIKNIRDVQRFFRGSLIGLELPYHPNIVQIKEVKRSHDRIYQVMGHIEGRTLYDLIKSQYILDEVDALAVLDDICHALVHLDQHQVLHRDVKPGNIFITKDWTCKLGDLGISRRLIDRTATTTGHVVGTPGYLAPEQVLDIRPLDVRADLFALGLTVFHGVTGFNPYERETAYKSMLARLEGPESKLVEGGAAPELSATVIAIINKLISRKTADRYDCPAAVIESIRRYTSK